MPLVEGQSPRKSRRNSLELSPISHKDDHSIQPLKLTGTRNASMDEKDSSRENRRSLMRIEDPDSVDLKMMRSLEKK
jgi:hypothetical protein